MGSVINPLWRDLNSASMGVFECAVRCDLVENSSVAVGTWDFVKNPFNCEIILQTCDESVEVSECISSQLEHHPEVRTDVWMG